MAQGRDRNQTKGKHRARKRERSNRQKRHRTHRLGVSAHETQASFMIHVGKACALNEMESSQIVLGGIRYNQVFF
jgi:hypothetical protein